MTVPDNPGYPRWRWWRRHLELHEEIRAELRLEQRVDDLDRRVETLWQRHNRRAVR